MSFTHEFVELDNKKDELITQITEEPIVNKQTSGSTSGGYTDNQIDEYLSRFLDISSNAQGNEHSEKQMSLKDGIKTFPKAAAWSFVLSSSIIMEGYDTNLLNSFYALDGFNRKYGQYYESIGKWQIPAK